MIVVNFAHPLTQEHIAQIESLAGQGVDRLVDLQVQFDHSRSFSSQLAYLIDRSDLSTVTLQTSVVIVNLPSLSPIAALVLADLHGRMGFFPPIIRLCPVEGCLPPRFEVAEIVNLQAVRDRARGKRYRNA
jgi:hypothetical protein